MKLTIEALAQCRQYYAALGELGSAASESGVNLQPGQSEEQDEQAAALEDAQNRIITLEDNIDFLRGEMQDLRQRVNRPRPTAAPAAAPESPRNIIEEKKPAKSYRLVGRLRQGDSELFIIDFGDGEVERLRLGDAVGEDIFEQVGDEYFIGGTPVAP